MVFWTCFDDGVGGRGVSGIAPPAGSGAVVGAAGYFVGARALGAEAVAPVEEIACWGSGWAIILRDAGGAP